METPTSLRKQAAEVGQRRALASELNQCVRALDFVERRQAADRDIALPLARAIIALDAVGKLLREFRPRHAEQVDKFLISERGVLQRAVDEKTKFYLTRHGDPEFIRLGGGVRWAKGVIARAATKARPAGAKKRAAVMTVRRLTTKSAGGRPQVMLTASSTSIDLDSDRFSLNALSDMKRGLKNRAAFIGHKYDPSTDIFGKIVGSEIVAKGAKSLLNLTVDVATENPRAVAVLDLIKSGVPIGASVGVVIVATSKDKTDPDVTILERVKPLEVSVVGLPANFTDAWVQDATKGKQADLRAALQ